MKTETFSNKVTISMHLESDVEQHRLLRFLFMLANIEYVRVLDVQIPYHTSANLPE